MPKDAQVIVEKLNSKSEIGIVFDAKQPPVTDRSRTSTKNLEPAEGNWIRGNSAQAPEGIDLRKTRRVRDRSICAKFAGPDEQLREDLPPRRNEEEYQEIFQRVNLLSTFLGTHGLFFRSQKRYLSAFFNRSCVFLIFVFHVVQRNTLMVLPLLALVIRVCMQPHTHTCAC